MDSKAESIFDLLKKSIIKRELTSDASAINQEVCKIKFDTGYKVIITLKKKKLYKNKEKNFYFSKLTTQTPNGKKQSSDIS